jgi:hypothetical protein
LLVIPRDHRGSIPLGHLRRIKKIIMIRTTNDRLIMLEASAIDTELQLSVITEKLGLNTNTEEDPPSVVKPVVKPPHCNPTYKYETDLSSENSNESIHACQAEDGKCYIYGIEVNLAALEEFVGGIKDPDNEPAGVLMGWYP